MYEYIIVKYKHAFPFAAALDSLYTISSYCSSKDRIFINKNFYKNNRYYVVRGLPVNLIKTCMGK